MGTQEKELTRENASICAIQETLDMQPEELGEGKLTNICKLIVMERRKMSWRK